MTRDISYIGHDEIEGWVHDHAPSDIALYTDGLLENFARLDEENEDLINENAALRREIDSLHNFIRQLAILKGATTP